MKVYMGVKRKTKENKYLYILTIYSNTGKVLHTSHKKEPISENKFDNAISGLEWASTTLKSLIRNKRLPKEEVTIFIDMKTLYKWFENEYAPAPYTLAFSNLLLDFSFLPTETEIIYSNTVSAKSIYKEEKEEKPLSVLEMFAMQG